MGQAAARRDDVSSLIPARIGAMPGLPGAALGKAGDYCIGGGLSELGAAHKG